jgi:hypothetical protein
MCYLVRQQQPEAELGGVAQPPGMPSMRPRWAGAAAFAVFGSLALAGALLTTPSMAPQVRSVKDAGAPQRTAEKATQLPAGGGLENTTLPMDDGVPTSTGDAPRAAIGHCHHDL